ncbi:MAG: polysaccharide pyruvyl transferase family protein [Candidatus Omnitrophota bacterium]|nr:MAG: polysaccharide pyruvyl transferase family protein [Candidatus Omnitrophota bacterium]
MRDDFIIQRIKRIMHTALGKLGNDKQCALLNYPFHFNFGDHFIWLGEIFYLTDIINMKINYTASYKDFSAEEMEKMIGKAPILLNGGGNLGDLWSREGKFITQIISKYHDRQIIVLPQSIYYTNQENLEKDANLFNAHPDLTLCVREKHSYDLALKHFSRCNVIMAPDMAFQLVNTPGLSLIPKRKQFILYLNRNDKEADKRFSPHSLDLDNLAVQDWVSFKWICKNPIPVRGAARFIREFWQRGLSGPMQWISRKRWEYFHSYTSKFNTLYGSSMHRRSWGFLHDAICQLNGYRLVITDRLHGHILCILLGIPHIFLPNTYYKNESFYKTWTHQISFCRFVKDPSQVKLAAQELLELSRSR